MSTPNDVGSGGPGDRPTPSGTDAGQDNNRPAPSNRDKGANTGSNGTGTDNRSYTDSSNNNNSQNNRGSEQNRNKSTFKGRCKEIENHVYDLLVSKVSSKQFTKTTKEIGVHVAGSSEHKHGGDIQRSMNKLHLICPYSAPPFRPGAEKPKNRGEYEGWRIKAQRVDRQIAEFKTEVRQIYGKVIGLCSDDIMALLEGESTYENIDNTQD